MSLFSERLSEIRKKRELLQAPIAEHLNVTRSAYSAWESGRNEPSLSYLTSICKYLNVSADYLLGLSDRAEPHLPLDAEEKKICNILTGEAARDPLDGLLPDQRKTVMALITLLLAENNEQTKNDEKEA